MGKFKFLAGVATAAFLAMSGAAQSAVIYNITAGNGATATASFTFGVNTLTVLLTNTTVNPGSVALNLSALNFAFAGGIGGSLFDASSPNFRTVSGSGPTAGVYADVAGPTTPATVGWVFSQPLGTYELNVLVGAGHAGPENTILGLPDPGTNRYAAAGGSIRNNSAHNPFLATSATFDFTFASGVSFLTHLTSVHFQFGTANGNFVEGVCNDGQSEVGACGDINVPEPGSSSLLLIALLSLGGLAFAGARRERA